jgi:prephenate dehydratase
MKKVAIQGTRGSYSEEAVLKMFGDTVEIVECENFPDTFALAEAEKVNYALVPLRNKIIGEIESAIREYQKTNLKILDQLLLDVRHVLIGTPDAEFEDIKIVRSHEEALKQCQNFLNEGGWEVEKGADTASSARRIVADGDKTKAAIASPRAAEIYGGKILREHIADDPANMTYFYLVGVR